MIYTKVEVAPGETLPLGIDWVDWLEPGGVVETFVAEAGPDLTLEDSDTVDDTTVATITMPAGLRIGYESWVKFTVTSGAKIGVRLLPVVCTHKRVVPSV